MQETVLAMLILASWTQELADDGPPVEPQPVKHIARIRTNLDGKVMEVTVEVTNRGRKANAFATAVVEREIGRAHV